MYGDAGEFDGRCSINLQIRNQWLYMYHGTDDSVGQPSMSVF